MANILLHSVRNFKMIGEKKTYKKNNNYHNYSSVSRTSSINRRVKIYVMDKGDFIRFEVNMSFGGYPLFATSPWIDISPANSKLAWRQPWDISSTRCSHRPLHSRSIFLHNSQNSKFIKQAIIFILSDKNINLPKYIQVLAKHVIAYIQHFGYLPCDPIDSKSWLKDTSKCMHSLSNIP